MTTPARIARAILLAAGNGSRHVEEGAATPKCLRQVGGVPILVRILDTLQAEGLREIVIVTGYEAERVREEITGARWPRLSLHFVENTRYNGKNGLSLLAASSYVDRPCLLSMADHLYSPELVRTLLKVQVPEGACALGVDHEIERCFDLEHATKVRVEGGRVIAIGKDLDEYDGVDTGIFRIGPAMVEALARIERAAGDASVSDGVRALASQGQMVACDVGRVRWLDIDTPSAALRAEAMIRVFGEHLSDEPGAGAPPAIDPESMELFAPSWVRAAKPYNEDHFALADRKGGEVLRMMSNESPFPPSPRVVAAVTEAAEKGHLYPSRARELQTSLADCEGLTAASVLLSAGSTELIDVVIRTFVAPGEEVLLSVPTFSMYEARTRVAGGIPILVPMGEDNEFDIPGLLRAVTERTKVVFLCTPNNPTGNSLSAQELRRVLRLGLPTVIDEAYHSLGAHQESLAPLLAEFPNAMLLRTFSKAYGLAGLRLGYVLAHPVVIQLLARVKVPWNVPATTLAAALAVLEDTREFEERMDALRDARQQLLEGLQAVRGVVPVPSEGNFVLVDVGATRLSADEVVAALLEEGVLIRSIAVDHGSRHFVRITVGTVEQNLRCVAAFERALGRAPKRPARGYAALSRNVER